MLVDFKGIVIVLAAIAAAALVCTIDLRCSGGGETPRRERTVANRVREEIAAGKAEYRSLRAENLENTIRALRVDARRLEGEGRAEDARTLNSTIIEMELEAAALRAKR